MVSIEEEGGVMGDTVGKGKKQRGKQGENRDNSVFRVPSCH